MTDETKAETWEEREARRVAEARTWDEAQRKADGDRAHTQLLERDAILAKKHDLRMAAVSREQTAATILAALIERGRGISHGDAIRSTCAEAVMLADALRAALAVPK